MIRRDASQTFEDIRKEVFFYEEEWSVEGWKPEVCKVVGEAVTSSIQDPKDWKQDFGKELLQQIKGQLVDCMREMWAEFSGMRGPPPAGNPSVREHPVRGPPLHQGSSVRWSNCPMPSPNQWDDQGALPLDRFSS
ncbi:UNVERIFIED_CONTAM: hypothetical protein FKN15_040821 [Acipenser sinensis]